MNVFIHSTNVSWGHILRHSVPLGFGDTYSKIYHITSAYKEFTVQWRKQTQGEKHSGIGVYSGVSEVDIYTLKLKYAETRNILSISSLTLCSIPSDNTHTQILNFSVRDNSGPGLPWSSRVKTPCFCCRGLGFNPWLGNEDRACCIVQ